MKKRNLLYGILMGSLFLACTTNSLNENNLNDTVKNNVNPSQDSFILTDDSDEVCNDPKITDPNYTGTICCTQRNTPLSLEDTIEYEYFTNLPNVSVSWEILSGDIEFVSDDNSKKVTIKLRDNFREGQLRGIGTSIDDTFLLCTHTITIKMDITNTSN